MNTLLTVLSTIRPPFLLLTPAILSLAYAISYWQQGFLDFQLSLLVFIAALMAHGLDPFTAVSEAQDYTWNALANAYHPGKGQLNPNRLFWMEEDQ